MENNYTEKQIIRFLYHETNLFEKLELEDAIAHDPEVRKQYQQLKLGFDQLATLSVSPSAQSVKNILGYSQKTSLSLA